MNPGVGVGGFSGKLEVLVLGGRGAVSVGLVVEPGGYHNYRRGYIREGSAAAK